MKAVAIFVISCSLFAPAAAQSTQRDGHTDPGASRTILPTADPIPRVLIPMLPPHLSGQGAFPFTSNLRTDLLLRYAIVGSSAEDIPNMAVSLDVRPLGTERYTTLRTILGAVTAGGVAYGAYEHLRKYRHLYR